MGRGDRFRPVVTARGKTLIGSRKERIKIPQPIERPVILRGTSVVRKEELSQSPWWFVQHKRGLRRIKIGEDVREARAVSKAAVRGTLPERIVYKYLLFPLRMKAGIDFDFQSSLQGGRLELGGIVADFLFPNSMMVLQVQGPTHEEHLRMRKDSEQRLILSEMGFTVVDLDDDLIYNEPQFKNTMHRLFSYNRQALTTEELMTFSGYNTEDDEWFVFDSDYKTLEDFYANYR